LFYLLSADSITDIKEPAVMPVFLCLFNALIASED